MTTISATVSTHPVSSDPVSSNPTHQRLHALDAIRAGALLLGIVLHATMSFQSGLATVGWPIVDVSPSTTLDLTFYVIHIFRMATFFFIAGFFAHLTFHRRGVSAFIKDRCLRILLPLVAFWPLCITTIGIVLTWAVVKLNGEVLPTSAPTESAATVEAAFPLTHLWFLYILLYLYLITLILRFVIAYVDSNCRIRLAVDRILAGVMHSYLAPIVAGLPVAISLYSIPDWIWWGGIPTPDQSLKPLTSSLLIFCYVFLLGWFFDRQRELLFSLQMNWRINLLIGGISIVVCLTLVGVESNFTAVTAGTDKFIYALSYGVAVMACSFAFIGAGLQFFERESPLLRYLADASYWMYLMHLALVMALQTWLMDALLHWSIKFLLINGLTFLTLLLSYHFFVRSTWIGKLLNGRRLPRAFPTRQRAEIKQV